jgi:hypothetical protein
VVTYTKSARIFKNKIYGDVMLNYYWSFVGERLTDGRGDEITDPKEFAMVEYIMEF